MADICFDITVIIPVYKVEKYIGRCLDSVIRQTYTKPFECILVDDCSPDESINIVRRMIDGYHGTISFQVLRHEHNSGLSAARNTGICHARSQYLLFLDSDDFLESHCLELLAHQLFLHPGVCMVLGNAQNNLSNTLEVSPDMLASCEDNRQIRSLFYKNELPVSAWNKLVRKDFLIRQNLFFKPGLLFEDLNWSYRLFRCLPSYAFVPEVTYVYEDNPNSIMHNAEREFNGPAQSYIYIFDEAIKDVDKDNYVECCLFILHHMLIVQDRINKRGVTKEIYRQFTHLKRVLSGDILRKRKVVLFLYSLLLFRPLCYLMNYALFRHHHYQIVRLVRRWSL